MESIYVFVYFVAFALIAGGAFAMMWGNIQSINATWDNPKPKQPQHPEAPSPGEEVMFVDLTRDKLEKLYDDK